jgi:hypothetical protein
MALDVNRWLKYAKARIDSALGQGNVSLDRLEAKREAELADKPWLRSDTSAPSLDEARARIAWEAERQRRPGDATPQPGTGGQETSGDRSDQRPPESPQGAAADAEHETARLELEQRDRASADRLEQIRRELGVGEPPADTKT